MAMDDSHSSLFNLGILDTLTQDELHEILDSYDTFCNATQSLLGGADDLSYGAQFVSHVHTLFMELTLTEQDAAHWVYRGEGAANIVVSYTGSSPSYIGKVMRIRKSPRKASAIPGVRNTIALSPHERLIWKEVHELISSSDKEIAGQLYVDHVMKPLLGSKYVDAGSHILVTKEFLMTVEKNVDSQRPASRVDVSQVDKQCDFALLMSDHSIFPQGIETLALLLTISLFFI
ncbi:unnamed protein product [Vicia faba]|uniref:Inositol-pentakisphosphate 2-kinase n=1 Tax=Vicia faba TaxID=3906 RepID=A0AAV1BB07_VICFA|nr:unnamed protein product [Vicia faba]